MDLNYACDHTFDIYNKETQLHLFIKILVPEIYIKTRTQKGTKNDSPGLIKSVDKYGAFDISTVLDWGISHTRYHSNPKKVKTEWYFTIRLLGFGVGLQRM